jgi:hypothetical protein
MSPKPPARLYLNKVLASVVDFLVAAGADDRQIAEIVERRLAHLRKTAGSPRPRLRGRGDDTVAAAVLHRWHRESALIDDNAMPRPLSLFGKVESIEALVRSEKPQRSARTIVADMKSLGLLRAAGANKYLPRARVATIDTMHPVLIEHVSKSLMRLLETVHANTNRRANQPPLIERFTHIPDLPIAKLNEFRQFSQEHGSAFLASVDDWLESRRVRNRKSSSGKGAAAGVHVYAYVSQPAKRPSRPSKRA